MTAPTTSTDAPVRAPPANVAGPSPAGEVHVTEATGPVAGIAAFRWAHRFRAGRGAAPALPSPAEYAEWRAAAATYGIVSKLLVARDGTGRIRGRTVLTLDRSFLLRHGHIGFFGAFDAVDRRTAEALLRAARLLARPYGVARLLGPVTYTTADLVGIEGRDHVRRPSLLTDNVPDHYQDLLVEAGATVHSRMSCYRWTQTEHLPIGRSIVDDARRAITAGGYALRDGDLKALPRELELLRSLYNDSFAHNPLSVSLDGAVFAKKASRLKNVLPDGYARVVERGGRPVAFLVLVPELAEALRLGPVTLARLMTRPTGLRLVRRHARSAAVLMIGVDPRHMGEGIGRILVGEIVSAALRFDLDAVTTTWIHEDNVASAALTGPLGEDPERRLSLFAWDDVAAGDRAAAGGPDR